MSQIETKNEIEARIQATYDALHAMPEIGLAEHRTSAWLAEKIKAAGFAVMTGTPDGLSPALPDIDSRRKSSYTLRTL